jgi:hypothetical protein
MLYGANQSMEPPPAQRPNLDRKPLFNASEGRDYAQDAPLRLSVDRQMTSRSKKSEERNANENKVSIEFNIPPIKSPA